MRLEVKITGTRTATIDAYAMTTTKASQVVAETATEGSPYLIAATLRALTDSIGGAA